MVLIEEIVENIERIELEQKNSTRGNVSFTDQVARRNEILIIKDHIKNHLTDFPDDKIYQRFFDKVEYRLKLENFSLSIPKGSQVIPFTRLKFFDYINNDKKERRFYIAPHFNSYDSDGLSMVIAFTPPNYRQPAHIQKKLQKIQFVYEAP